MDFAISAFIGAFAALVAIAEINLPNKWLRYLVALVIGATITVALAIVVSWCARALGHAR